MRNATSPVGLLDSVRGISLQRMGREHYKVPEEDVAAEFDRVCQLFQLAMGKPSDRVLFESLMGEASDKGMNWVQGLQYVVEHREASDTEAAPVRRPVQSVGEIPPYQREFRQAG